MHAEKENFSLSDKRICIIRASWHSDIVKSLNDYFLQKSKDYSLDESRIDTFSVPGSLEIPLQAQLCAKTGLYDGIVVMGLITDGGIYRHDFVSQSVLDSIMKIQLEQEVPIIYAVLTPHHFHSCEDHEQFFIEQLKKKGVETAKALYQTLLTREQVSKLS